jgi:transcriptional regulator with XRE-family HTH domain
LADFGSEVRRLLSERDMSLRELARRVHCDAGYLSKMVNGRKPAPPHMAAILDDVLSGGGALTEAAAVPALTVSASRRGRAGWVPRVATDAEADAVWKIIATFRRLDNKFGGAHAHKLAADYLDSTVLPMLRTGTYTEEIGQRLFAGAAQLAHLVAWTAYDMNNHRRAHVYFGKALDLSSAAGEPAFAGEILAARSHQAIHMGDPVKAAELARACQQIAKKTAVPALLAEACQLEANSHALLGDARACAACLRDSEHAFALSEPAESPQWLGFLDKGYLAARFAHCFRDLGDWGEARRYALAAVQMSDSLVRARAFNTAILATTYVETDLDQACHVGLEALDLAASLQSARVARYIDDLCGRLRKRHKDEPAVEHFGERVRETLGAA